MDHKLKDVAEMILWGLAENDKVSVVEILNEVSTADKIVLAIETDTGQSFFADIIPS